jgi:hypothetical protein
MLKTSSHWEKETSKRSLVLLPTRFLAFAESKHNKGKTEEI